jgi:hypothetical protein
MLRFTIRDVLWLTVVVGLSLGWLLEDRRATSFVQEAIAELKQMEGQTYYRPTTGVLQVSNYDGFVVRIEVARELKTFERSQEEQLREFLAEIEEERASEGAGNGFKADRPK